MMTVKIIVTGKVQGVWFRKNTKSAADRFNITGSVENKPDGTVHIIATGEKEAISQFIAWCEHGDPPAEVMAVSVSEVDGKDFDRFEILRS